MISIQLDKVEVLAQSIADSMGCEVIDCRWLNEQGHWVLRVLLDRPEGLLLQDCENFSRALSPALDVEDFIPAKYHLEVSSPGLDRPLKTKTHFERFLGSLASVSTEKPIEGRKNFKGILYAVEGQRVAIQIEDQIYWIPFNLIVKAKKEIDWDREIKKGQKKK